MRKIAQKGVRAPQVNRAAKEAKASMLKKYQTGGRKKAQGGGKFEDYNEKNRYAGGSGILSRMLSGAYENQEWVKAKRADDLRLSKMTQEQRDNEKAYYQRRAEMAKQDQEAKDKMKRMSGKKDIDQQRRGGKSAKRVKKAQTGAKTSSPKNLMTSSDYNELFPYGKTKSVRRSGDRMWKDKEVKIATPSRTITKSVRKKTVLGKLSNAKGRTGKKVYGRSK